MNTRTVVRVVALTVAVALTVIAINLHAYVAAPMLPAETLTVAEHAGAHEGAYSIGLPVNSLLCPC